MAEQMSVQADVWNVLLVEDDDTIRAQVKDYLSGETFASRSLNISEIAALDDALNIIRERKADLIVLDVYRGRAQRGGEQTGIQILERIRQTGFVPVVLYTALPEGLDGFQDRFVRLVGKDAGGLEMLRAEIEDLFALRIPQTNRAIVNHIDQAMCDYMWGFVRNHWHEFEPIIDKPEFLRLVIQRLALTFARQGIDQLTAEVYGALPATGQATDDDIVHPAEYYIKPPVGNDPALGDVRIRQIGITAEYLVVLWPTCDMVSSRGRIPKTDCVLCAKASLAGETPEVAEWYASPSNTRQKKVERLVKNTRDESPDRYHFLPGVWDIPDLVVDFQKLEHVALNDIKSFTCLATLASPFSEALGARFQRYIGRLGTPDLDVNTVLEQIKSRLSPPGGGNSGQ